MNTTLAHSITTEIWDGTAYDNIANTGTTFTWVTDQRYMDTLVVNLSWGWFPETARIRFTLPASQFKSTLGDAQTTDIQQVFDTTGNKQTFPIADSGMILCGAGVALQVACPSGGFPSQDGDFTNVPRARSFTGPSAHGTYSSDYTTIDNVTGLRWKSCTEGLSGATCASGSATAVVWENSVNACAALNSANAGAGYWGLTNWRLPTQSELASIPSYATPSPATIEPANFPATLSLTYWASGYYSNGTRAYGVRFAEGTINDGVWDFRDGITTGYVRCVSAPAVIQLSSFFDNGDGTVSDLRTGLRWQRCTRGQTNDSACSGAATTGNWASNLAYCDTLTLGSHANASNWRVPNMRELYSITFIGNGSLGVEAAYFPNTASNSYVSATTRPAGGNFVLNRGPGPGIGANGTGGVGFTARCVSTE